MSYPTEKPKEEAAALAGTTVASGPASGPAAGSAPTDANKRNVNAWHWEENDYTNWAKDVIKKKLLSVRVEQGIGNVVKVTEVSKLSGDAYVNTRKGRVFAGYEFKINLEWTGEVLDASGNVTTTYKGKAHMPEVSADVDDCDFEVSSIKLEGNESPEKDALLKLFQTAGRKVTTGAFPHQHTRLCDCLLFFTTCIFGFFSLIFIIAVPNHHLFSPLSSPLLYPILFALCIYAVYVFYIVSIGNRFKIKGVPFRA